jgi:hypothetical protein
MWLLPTFVRNLVRRICQGPRVSRYFHNFHTPLPGYVRGKASSEGSEMPQRRGHFRGEGTSHIEVEPKPTTPSSYRPVFRLNF